MIRSQYLLTAAALSLGACTTVRTEALDPATTTASSGFVYYLPIRTLNVDAKFVVSDCGRNGQGPAVLNYDVAPTVTSAIAAERLRPFVIGKGLEGKALKALNVEIATYENGTLKSFNAVADDRTAETATNVLTGVAKFGLGLTGMGLFSLDDDQDQPGVTWLSDLYRRKAKESEVSALRKVCGARLTDALLKVYELTSKIDGAVEAADAKGKLTAAVANAEKAVVDARLGLKAAKEVDGAEDLAMARETLAEAVRKLAEARKSLAAGAAAAPPSTLNQQIALIVQRDLTFNASTAIIPTESPAGEWPVTYAAAELQSLGIRTETDMAARVELKLVSARSGAARAADEAPKGGKREGIWIRVPAMAQLKICRTESCTGETTRLSQTISVPQWGQMSVIPLKNMMFSRSSTKVAFAPDGALTSLNFESTAAAEKGSAAFAQSGEIFLDFVTKRRALLAEMRTAETAAEKAEVQQQIDMIDLEQRLAQVQSTIGPDRQNQLNTIQFEIDQTKKLRELEEEKRKLDAIRNGSE